MNDYALAKRYVNKVKSCKDTGQTFTLSLSDFKKLYNRKTCYYTGVKLNYTTNSSNSLTLDRIDCNIGYTPENTVACCHAFNALKATWENPRNTLTQKRVAKALTTLEKVNDKPVPSNRPRKT